MTGIQQGPMWINIFTNCLSTQDVTSVTGFYKMTTDHSQSYKGLGIRAFGHRSRLRAIFRRLRNLDLAKDSRFLDVGCSNGYITHMICQKFDFNTAIGVDHNIANIALAQRLYPKIRFEQIDLNILHVPPHETFDLVTCFETLEHVGNLENAIANILARISHGGRCLISVPIEHGLRGFVKYLIKKMVFRYDVSELKISEIEYLKMLLSNGRLSRSRPKADGYGTHFGFDYRDVDDFLTAKGVKFTALDKGMTRFYVVNG